MAAGGEQTQSAHVRDVSLGARIGYPSETHLKVNIMAADALAPYFARTAAMTLTM